MNVLQGIRVVDVTMWAFVPAAGGIMAHWGADVIKVENPRAPDPIRAMGAAFEADGLGMGFKHYSRGKRSIGLDVASDEGRELLYRLVESADVFLTSYLEETRRKLRIDVEDIRARNPRIVYARGSGHGPKGPDAQRGGYDSASWWSRSSLANSAMEAASVDFPPVMIGHGDGMAGVALAGGICAALLQRERAGVAPVVDASLLGTAIWFNGPAIISARRRTTPAGPIEAGRYPVLPATTGVNYKTKDGRYLALVMLGDSDADWQDLCEHIGRPEFARDPRFLTSADRMDNREEAVRLLDKIFAERTFAEWNRVLATTRGVWAPVQTAAEIHDDPQTIANGFLREVNYPGAPVRLPVPPVLFDEEGGDPQPAPQFAAHTDEVLGEIGLSPGELRRLRDAGVIA